MSSFIPKFNSSIIKPKVFIPMWLYKWLAVMPFIGFVGLDHWAIDSKFTGMAKLVVNIFTLGSWYAYDIVQAWSGIRANKATVQAEGLDLPFLEGFNIGKGKFDNEPFANMSKNTQMWLLLLFIALFGFIYYILSFFITSESGFILTSLTSLTFYGIFILLAYAIFFYFTTKSPTGVPLATPKTSVEAKQNLYSSFNVANPLTVKSSSSRVSGVLSGVATGLTLPRMGGGGSVNDLIDTLKTMEPKPFNHDHLYFSLLILILPLSGFIAYALKKYKTPTKKDEIS